MAELNPNAITGLGSKLNTKQIVERFMAIEKRRIKPIEARKDQKLSELEAWEAVKMELQKLQGVTESLDKPDIWEARRVETSNPDVVVPNARRNAEPGKHTIIVDSIALSHQITSQGFEREDTQIGTGQIKIQVGQKEDDTPVTINLAEGKDTLKDLKQAINSSDADVEAYIAKTHGDEPYRLLLTSKVNGEEGRIYINIDLDGGDVDPPTYVNTFDRTATWKGLAVKEQETISKGGVGSSTPIVGMSGVYTGEEDNQFTFRVIRSGIIPSDAGVVIGWEDENGRSGQLDINKYNYVPGTPIEVTDGLQMLLSDGEVVDGDTFKVKAFAEKSDMLWWKNAAERAPQIEQPTDWSSKATDGGIRVTGTYDGEDDQSVIFRVEGSGQVGGPSPLKVHYEFTDTGETGSINIGQPYLGDITENDAGLDSATAFDSEDGEELFELEFNKKGGRDASRLPIGHGLFIEVKPSVLRDGDTTDVEVLAPSSDSLWWLDEELQGVSGKVDAEAKWQTYEEYEDLDPEDALNRSGPSVMDGIKPFLSEKSNAAIEVSGQYDNDVSKTYTFTVEDRGNVGVTRALKLTWEDTFGATGTLEIGEGYVPGTSVPFDSGLFLALGEGELYQSDSFTISTETSTVRQAQDLVLRLGASEQGGGLEVRRSENAANDVIPGLDLEFFSSSEKPVTVSILGDTEVANERIHDFVDAYNTFQATSREVAKFDKANNIAAPLLSDRNLAQVVNDVATTSISTVSGLPQSSNMLFAVGLKLDDKGVMTVDEKKLNEKIVDSFSDVANLFRSHGKSDNPGITFVGMGDKTRVNPSGYQVNITSAAKKGTYMGTPIAEVISINEQNNILIVKNNGRASDPIELRKDTYTVGSLAKAIQNRLVEDKSLGRRGIQVRAEEGRLKFIAGSFGKSSTIEIEAGADKDLSSLGLVGGESITGEDVAGSMGNVEATGRGQLLVGQRDTDTDGLRVFVTMGEKELVEGDEANVSITKGVAVKLANILEKLNDPIDGNVKKTTDDITGQMRSFDDQMKRLLERAEEKQTRLQQKFAKLDSTMGRLNSQKSYISQQLSAMGGEKK